MKKLETYRGKIYLAGERERGALGIEQVAVLLNKNNRQTREISSDRAELTIELKKQNAKYQTLKTKFDQQATVVAALESQIDSLIDARKTNEV